MDKRLEDALDYSNFRMILTTRQENLKVLMNNKLVLPYAGGLFKVDRELLLFLDMLSRANEKSFIFIDINDTPILIDTIEDFGLMATEKYVNALNQYHKSYQKLSEAREIRKVINLDGEE